MTTTGENFRTLLLTKSDITDVVGTRIHQNKVPEAGSLPYIWFMRRGVEYLDTMGDPETVPYREFFNLECVSTSVDEAIDLSDTVRSSITAHSGAMGDVTVQWIDVRNQSDDYLPRNVAADEMVNVASIDVEIVNQ